MGKYFSPFCKLQSCYWYQEKRNLAVQAHAEITIHVKSNVEVMHTLYATPKPLIITTVAPVPCVSNLPCIVALKNSRIISFMKVATSPFRSSHCYIIFHAYSVVICIGINPQRIFLSYPRKMAEQFYK